MIIYEISLREPDLYSSIFRAIHTCDHPAYNSCTLYSIGKKGLAVIQQRYDPETKKTWWTEIDPWLTDQLYLHPKFKEFFDDRSGPATDGLYLTVTIRQIMWGTENEAYI